MYRDISLLAVCQALLMTGTGLVIATSSLIGNQLAIHPALATLPLSVQYLTTMLVMIPVSRTMQRWGRRPVFVLGALIGSAGMALAAFGVWMGSFLLFAGAGVLIGLHNAIGQFYRFAAAEAAPVDLKSRAISLTLAGGVVAAFIGPNLAALTRDLVLPPFTASFIVLCAVTVLAATLVSRLRLPPPPPPSASGGEDAARPLAVVLRQPALIVAVLAGTLGYAVMTLLMVATPLAMEHNTHTFSLIAGVIQWHIVAMFAPSFITGDLIRRFGVKTIILVGALLQVACVVVAVSGVAVIHYTASLILLGLGWNFLYIGGTTLLTTSHRPSEKGYVQGINDTVVFTVVTLASLASGGLQSWLGWATLNLLSLIGPAVVILALGWLMWREAKG